MSIELTPIAGDFNSYIDSDQAEEYALVVADITAWSTADEATRLRALRQATMEIDSLQWPGMPYADWETNQPGTQERAFPRFVPDDPSEWPAGKMSISGHMLDLDTDDQPIVPERVKRATFCQALSILRAPHRRNRLQDQADNVASQSAGGISETYDLSKAPKILCIEAMQQLRPYFQRSGNIL